VTIEQCKEVVEIEKEIEEYSFFLEQSKLHVSAKTELLSTGLGKGKISIDIPMSYICDFVRDYIAKMKNRLSELGIEGY
jgi:hypothetical protein